MPSPKFHKYIVFVEQFSPLPESDKLVNITVEFTQAFSGLEKFAFGFFKILIGETVPVVEPQELVTVSVAEMLLFGQLLEE